MSSRPDPAATLAVFTTVGSEAEARAMASAMVERRLAACAQVSAIESWYEWQGALQHEREWRILFKTVAARWDDLQAALLAQHPYELPAIWATPLGPVEAGYAAWVQDHSRGEPKEA